MGFFAVAYSSNAHGEVRLDARDHHGIFNADQQRYAHKLRLIKRLLAE